MASPLKTVATRQSSVISMVFLFLLTAYRLTLTPNCYAQNPHYIRVLIIQDAESLNIKSKGPYEVADVSRKKILSKGSSLKTTVISYKDGISIGSKNFNAKKIFIKTFNPDLIIINGRTYRGDIALIKNENKKFSVVNYIELEDYIKGISIREISHYWPPEAIKASAIAFRTFALYKAEENANDDYDLTSDIYSQVYSGRAAERYRINKAVDETRGLVLVYQGKIFPAFYHATCAGHTEDASMLWNIDVAPLKGVPCSFCKDSPHFNWHYVASIEEVKDKLAKAREKIGVIKNIAVLGRDASGRIKDLKIISGKDEIKISAKDFRNIIGPNFIRSTNFSVKLVNHDLVFEGLGWGHGVGLCQWGSYFMAKEAHTYQEILQYYYPHSEIIQF